MASRPFTPNPRRSRPHNRNSQWRRDRRPRPSVASLHAALAVIPSLPRPVLDRLTQRCIDRLDEMEGDNDLELNGDETDHTQGEDEGQCSANMWIWSGPGCPISDPDIGVDDGGEDVNEDGADGADVTLKTLPQYDIDQTRGPINLRVAYRDHYLAMIQG